ncbi:Signal peptidase I [Lactobacillus equicursoris DSM 19284 = JCM 14600 = CIP 110162]|uniref:Signal peptidase I n=1 Tax=Lactobacillus equicursoris DSM 19284 = JCM 14600 = CIP 110162 TaxID=1293597 RepID=K0NUA4_9LACO|nr:signal peptidase I [Lactobacillus equicursoris]KRL02946.1 signal peptidase i [Lactobacillus equicursoris DSM 19284 = JCM 14600 = CIP 110162]CCK86039.1 Signal peptidase I [Lactobacillus equicursoris DSM 19284 = JCM 14600 = CIP 110162]
MNKKKQAAEEESWGKFFRDVLVMFLIFVSIYYVVFSFFLANEVVSGPSMQPTFEDGDRLIAVRKFTPKRNDVVIIKAPDQAGAMYIKRVIGLPGDTVQSKNDVLYINGKKVAQPYLNNKYKKADNLAGSNYTSNFKVKIKKDYYWVMGDHRDVSKDSRKFGQVKRSYLLSKVVLRYWPVTKISTNFY